MELKKKKDNADPLSGQLIPRSLGDTQCCPLSHVTAGLCCPFSGSHRPQLEGAMVHPPAEHTAVLQAPGRPEGDPSQGPDPSGWLHHHLPLPGVWKPTRKWRLLLPAPFCPEPSHLWPLWWRWCGYWEELSYHWKKLNSSPAALCASCDLGQVIEPLSALVPPL